MIRTKRVYEAPSQADGTRLLVDRLWPRGLTKETAHIDAWRRDLAPSPELRIWFGHRPDRYARFRERYRMELLRHHDALVQLALDAEAGAITLVYAARDPQHSNATVLRELIEDIAGVRKQDKKTPERSPHGPRVRARVARDREVP